MSLTTDTVYSVTDINNQLKNNIGTSTIKEVVALGYYTPNDGGGGTFFWDATSTLTNDNGTVIQVGSSSGRWRRVFSEFLNVKWFGAKGDGITNDTSAIQNAISSASTNKIPLCIPTGNYLITGTIVINSYVHVIGAGIGETTLKFDTTFSGGSDMLQCNAQSYVEIEKISFTGVYGFTGTYTKYCKSFIAFNSYNGTNINLKVHDCEFSNANVYQAINLGDVSSSTETHSNTEIYLYNNYFHDLYMTGYQNVTANNVDGNFLCRGINLRATSKLTEIYYNRFERLSGDGVFGYGQTTAGTIYSGNCNIHHNYFYQCQMGVEINGNYLGYNQTIFNNWFYFMSNNGGYAISTDSYNCKVLNNFIHQHDRSGIEYTSLGGLIQGNTIIISPYVSGEGLEASVKEGDAQGIEAYGFAGSILDNEIVLQHWKTVDTNTPAHYNGIKLLGMSTEGNDPNTGLPYQPTSYPAYSNGAGGYVSGTATGWKIEGNYCENPTRAFILADVNKIDKVWVKNNTVIGYYTVICPVMVHGNRWIIQNNLFDMTGATYIAGTNFIAEIFVNTSAGESAYNSYSIFSDNTIIGDSWKPDTTNQLLAYRNTYRNSSDVDYMVFPAPVITQTQRTALTGTEGLTVYQTDGTIGLYIYTSSAWRRVSLV